MKGHRTKASHKTRYVTNHQSRQLRLTVFANYAVLLLFQEVGSTGTQGMSESIQRWRTDPSFNTETKTRRQLVVEEEEEEEEAMRDHNRRSSSGGVASESTRESSSIHNSSGGSQRWRGSSLSSYINYSSSSVDDNDNNNNGPRPEANNNEDDEEVGPVGPTTNRKHNGAQSVQPSLQDEDVAKKKRAARLQLAGDGDPQPPLSPVKGAKTTRAPAKTTTTTTNTNNQNDMTNLAQNTSRPGAVRVPGSNPPNFPPDNDEEQPTTAPRNHNHTPRRDVPPPPPSPSHNPYDPVPEGPGPWQTLPLEPPPNVVVAVRVDNKGPISKKMTIVLCLIIVVVAAAAVAGGIALGRRGGGGGNGGQSTTPNDDETSTFGPTPSPIVPCNVCFGQASVVFDETVNRQTFQFQNRDYSCVALADETVTLDVEDPKCPVHQAIAWKHCGCTNLPPPPVEEFSNACPICPGNVPPLAPNSECRQEMEFAAIVGSALFEECPAQVVPESDSSSCMCPLCSDARCVELQGVLVDLVDDPIVFTNSSTDQYKALTWLAVGDPGDPAVVRPTPDALRERFVLAVLYYATGGAGWRTVRFLSESHVCGWTGIACASDNTVTDLLLGECVFFSCRVYMIVVCALACFQLFFFSCAASENLIGSIPIELRSLSSLVRLNLAMNSLVGSIPSELGSIASLEVFEASANMLTGPLPESIFYPPNMVTIDLRTNAIEGTLPASLSNATSLRQLLLADNLLGGKIPRFIGESTSLEAFYIWSNSFRGSLPEFNPLSPMWFLSLGENELSGTIPASLTVLSDLQVLVLRGNAMSGPIPPFSGRFGSLRILDISNRALTGNFGEILATLSPNNLDTLDFSTSMVSGTLPSTIGDFRVLNRLWLHDTRLGGTLPSELGRLSGLTDSINFNNCGLSGTLPTELGQLSLAYSLYVASNNLNGTIPSEIGMMNSLAVFEAAHNDLSGTVPTEVGNCRRLEEFGIFGNGRVNGKLSDLVNVLPPSTRALYLGELALTGSIPSSIGRLTLLERFFASENALTGTLPTEFGNLRSMVFLNVFGNLLNGTIPGNLGLMNELTDLSLGFNSLTGTVPQEFQTLRSLIKLDLSGNGLTGPAGFLSTLPSLSE